MSSEDHAASDYQVTVADNPEQFRFEVHVGGALAGFTEYEFGAHQLTFVHTEVFPDFAGRGLARRLAGDALDEVRGRGLSVVPQCPFIRKYIRTNRQYVDLVPEARRSEFGL